MRVPTLHRSLAAHGFGGARLTQWALAVAGACSIVVAGWCWLDSEGLEERAGRLETSAGRLQEANRAFLAESLREGFDLSEKRSRSLAQEISFSKQVAARHAFSWTQFLSALEETVPVRVSINSVTIAPQTSVISLSGSALSLTDVTAFVSTLDRHPVFRNVVLSQHRVKEPAKDQGPGGRSRPFVEFTLSVTYRPPV